MKACVITIDRTYSRIRKLPREVVGVVMEETSRAVLISGEYDGGTIKEWMSKTCVKIGAPEEISILEGRRKASQDPAPAAKSKAKSKGKTAVVNGDFIAIRFPYSPETVARVKTLVGVKLFNDNPSDRYWVCPFSVRSASNLMDWGFELDGAGLKRLEKERRALSRKGSKWRGEQRKLDLPEGLRDYQNTGALFVDAAGGRAIIADEMGLGKTPQSLAWAGAAPEVDVLIAVVPQCAKIHWSREASRWMWRPNVYVISGRFGEKNNDWTKFIVGRVKKQAKTVIIINYDILPNKNKTIKMANGKTRRRQIPGTGWVDNLPKPDLVIIDEVQKIKTTTSRRTIATTRLCASVKYAVGLSGTPIEARPSEFFPILHIVAPDQFPDFWLYCIDFCNAHDNGWGWDYSGSSNLDKLRKMIEPFMIRRLKSDVLKDLPEKQRVVIPVEISNRREYELAFNNLEAWLKSVGKKPPVAESLARFAYLKQIAARGKLPSAIEWIEDYMEATGRKLVVFAVHHEMIDALYSHFRSVAVKFDGRTPAKLRQKAVDGFQEDPKVRLFIGQVEAAGTAITLTAAQDTLTVELMTTPAPHLQAEDRVHRIGQTAQSVTAYYMLAENTIEERLVTLCEDKQSTVAQLLPGDDHLLKALYKEAIK